MLARNQHFSNHYIKYIFAITMFSCWVLPGQHMKSFCIMGCGNCKNMLKTAKICVFCNRTVLEPLKQNLAKTLQKPSKKLQLSQYFAKFLSICSMVPLPVKIRRIQSFFLVFCLFLQMHVVHTLMLSEDIGLEKKFWAFSIH